jgi:hypothetical protein
MRVIAVYTGVTGMSWQLYLRGSKSGRSLTRMKYRLTLVPLLGVVLLTLVAFAHASPPDETWQPGIYDDADFDDVVDFIVSLSAAPVDSVPGLSHRAPAAAAALVVSEPRVLPPRQLFPKDPRSPPSS